MHIFRELVDFVGICVVLASGMLSLNLNKNLAGIQFSSRFLSKVHRYAESILTAIGKL